MRGSPSLLVLFSLLVTLSFAGASVASPVALAQSATRAQASVVQPGDDPAVGVIVDTANPRSMQLASEAGFSYAKMIVQWARLEPKRGRYTFADSSENDIDNVVNAARGQGLKIVVRVDGVPDWAGGAPAKVSPDAVEAFYAAMAAHAKGSIAAYEVLNEPNLPFEWGGPPSPSGYVAFVKAAYRGVKRGDPGALVIGGGLSPAAGGGGSMDDLEFLRGMYAAGVRGSMDAVAVHNYGGGFEPERDPGDCGICFRRAETYRQIMLDQGDGATPIWATEFGWLLDPGRDMGQYDWMRVSADKQAEYVVRAFRYARANWPWMGGLVLSNLDASTSPYHTGPQDGMPWFAILNKDYSPRPAWKAFKTWREQDRAALASRPQTAANAAPPAQTDPPPTVDIPAFPTPIPIPTPVPSATPTATVTVTSQPLPEPGPTDTPGPTPAVPSVATPIPSVATPMTTSQGLSTSAASVRVQVVRTDGTGVNLRARPRADAEALEVVPEDAFLDVVGDDVVADGRTWRNVQTAGGRTGWVAAQYLSP